VPPDCRTSMAVSAATLSTIMRQTLRVQKPLLNSGWSQLSFHFQLFFPRRFRWILVRLIINSRFVQRPACRSCLTWTCQEPALQPLSGYTTDSARHIIALQRHQIRELKLRLSKSNGDGVLNISFLLASHVLSQFRDLPVNEQLEGHHDLATVRFATISLRLFVRLILCADASCSSFGAQLSRIGLRGLR